MSLFDRVRRMFGSKQDEDPAGDGCHDGITCEEALRLVHDFIDGELEGVSYAEVRTHFEVCVRCFPHMNLERRFREAVRRACARETAPPALRERVLDIVAGGHPDA